MGFLLPTAAKEAEDSGAVTASAPEEPVGVRSRKLGR